MAKRMILMLAVVIGIIGGLGFVKFRQIQTAIAQGAAFQPPPEAVTTIVAQQETWPATLERHRHGGRRAGRDRERGPARHRRADRVRVRASRCARARCSSSSTRARSGRSWPRSKRSASWRAELRADAGPAERARRSRGRSTTGRRPSRSRPRRGSARSAPTIERKTIRAPFSGVLGIRQVEPRPVPRRRRSGRPAAVARSDLRELRRAAAGRRPGARRARRCASRPTMSAGRAVHRTRHGDRFDRGRGDAERPGAGDARQPGRHAAARHVRPDGGRRWAPAARSIALPASAISYAPYGDSVFVVDRPEGPERARRIAACASSS